MKTTKIIAAAALSFLAAAAAHAATDAPARVATCVACHGTQGEGSASGVPRLAGQNAEYLARALAAFRGATRASPVMQPIAGSLSDVDIHDLSAYFAGLPASRTPEAQPQAAGLVAAGKQLAQAGAAAAGVPACASCHGAGPAGSGARFPGLEGQPAAFVVSRLHEFQARAEKQAPEPGSMTAIAVRLNDMQIKQAAAYFSTLRQP
jgi:cytochrome c553